MDSVRTFTAQFEQHVNQRLRQFVAGANLGQGLGEEASRCVADHFQRIGFALDAPEHFLDAGRRFLAFVVLTVRLASADTVVVVHPEIGFLDAPKRQTNE